MSELDKIKALVKALKEGGYKPQPSSVIPGVALNKNFIEPTLQGSDNGLEWLEIKRQEQNLYAWVREIDENFGTNILIKQPPKDALVEFQAQMYRRVIKLDD